MKRKKSKSEAVETVRWNEAVRDYHADSSRNLVDGLFTDEEMCVLFES